MNVIQRGILLLIRSAITGETLTLPQEFNLADAEKLIISHQIVGLVYEGAVRCGIPKTEPVMGRLFQLYCQIIFRSNTQLKAVDTLFAAFEEQGIDYMPVKGCTIKPIYPQAAMRVMTDADILIHEEQYGRIRQITQAQGYQELPEEDHVFLWANKAIELELHKHLVPASDKDYYDYMGDSWQRAKHISGHRYELSPEDSYIFQLVHFAKHYRSSGIGLRQAVDLWVYARHYHEMDMDYIRQELNKLNMVDFWQNIQQVLRVWFEDEEPTQKALFISQFIFDSGSWGTREQKQLFVRYQNIKKTGSMRKSRWLQIFNALFLDKYSMKKQFPVLMKAPWLLPVMWPVRWVKIALFRRERIRVHLARTEQKDIQQIETFEQSMEYVGLT